MPKINDYVKQLEEQVDAITAGNNEVAVKLLLNVAIQYMAKLEADQVELSFLLTSGERATVSLSVEVE